MTGPSPIISRQTSRGARNAGIADSTLTDLNCRTMRANKRETSGVTGRSVVIIWAAVECGTASSHRMSPMMDQGRGNRLNRDSESDWSVFGDWQRVASLLIAVAYLLVSPILFPAGTWSHLMADILVRTMSLVFPL